MWIYRDRGHYWFEPDEVPPTPSGLSGGEHRMVLIAASLADPDGVRVGLGEVVTGLDREATALVLSAIAHSARTPRAVRHLGRLRRWHRGW